MRLDRMLGLLNVCSRRECPRFLAGGHVTVEGVPALNANLSVDEKSRICVDGQILDHRINRYLMMNKPSGILTAAEDSRCQTVLDLLPSIYHSLACMPVGRLDKDTTGLLLFTTDGQLAHRLISPKYEIRKTYLALVEGILDESDIIAFEEGIPLKDFRCLPAKLEILEPDIGRVTVFEGKYHQVKRMFGARGKTVKQLKRTSFGPFELESELMEGEYRELTDDEIDLLYRSAAMERIE